MELEKLNYLNQFVGHKVEISNRNVLNKDLKTTFIYDNFVVDYNTYDQLILMDGNDSDCITYIPLDSIEKISKLNDDLYLNVVSINTIHYCWNICCVEDKVVLPRCFKCGNEIGVDDTIWRINGIANYGSHYDDVEINQVVNNLDICDCCVHDFIGDI
jgi:hypothetical protein